MRDPQPIERFSESDHSTFTEYELSRLGVRHDRVTDKDIDEARSTEPSLAAELDSLFSRVRAATSAPCGSDPTSELVGEMERTVATLLHAALVECLAAAGMDEEVAHIKVWAGDGTASAAFTVAATMPDPSRPSLSQPGELVIAPPFLKWQPSSKAVSLEECGAEESEPMQWPLTSFAGMSLARAKTLQSTSAASCACCKARMMACSLPSKAKSISFALSGYSAWR
mmetsp:Transcript_24351/g.62202  ORF Transcript_24351/g.62202 Transcript_24351/m.62202 type:complete len:226 (+) Transcript_24351:292-969(+)